MAGAGALVHQAEFVEDVLSSGVLVYLSTSWLAELYQQVLNCDLLQQAGYEAGSHGPAGGSSLINLLTGNQSSYHSQVARPLTGNQTAHNQITTGNQAAHR